MVSAHLAGRTQQGGSTEMGVYGRDWHDSEWGGGVCDRKELHGASLSDLRPSANPRTGFTEPPQCALGRGTKPKAWVFVDQAIAGECARRLRACITLVLGRGSTPSLIVDSLQPPVTSSRECDAVFWLLWVFALNMHIPIYNLKNIKEKPLESI